METKLFICKMPDCDGRRVKLGFCNKHYLRNRIHGDPNKILQPKVYHGGSDTLTYGVWCAMKARCGNERDKNYPNYGGRGIKVCPEWVSSFKNFIDDMGYKPTGLTLERIDNDGNYEPSNCKWADRETQSINKRLRSTNKSGQAGVFFDRRLSKWLVFIDRRKKRTHIGYYAIKEDAIKARREWELKLQ